MLKTNYFIGCLAVAFSLFSCTKSKSYDIKGDPEVKFFTNTETSGNLIANSKNYSVINIPDVAGSGLLNLSSTVPGTIQFPVFATKPVSKDVVVAAELDNSLVAAYNANYNTNYKPLPAGVFNTNGLIAHIMKDSTRSADSITIIVNAGSLNTLTEKAYMAPIRLNAVSDPLVGGITSNSATRVTYIIVNVEVRNIKYLAVAADALGTLVTPRTAWTAIFNPAPSTTGNIFDGSTTTYTRWSASPGQVDVNMQATKNVTGIRLYTANVATYVPTKVDVYLSNDGVTYDLIGSPLKANLTYASSYNYILFYKAIPAKFIRLVLSYTNNTNTQNYRVVEFDVYAN
jgi:hypothetical protein